MTIRTKLKAPVTRVGIRLYTEDIELGKSLHNTGYNAIVRELFHNYCNKIRAKQLQEATNATRK